MTDQQRKQANVRRAVRLLAAYHARLLDALQRIEAVAIEEVPGLSFHHWEATHHAPVDRASTSPLRRWGWDFVPLQNTSFVWTTGAEDAPKKAGQVALYVQHVADDGYDSGISGRRGPDPTKFADAETCGSWLYVWIYGLTSGKCGATWKEVEAAYETADLDDIDWDGQVHDVEFVALAAAEGCRFRYVGWKIRIEDIGTDEEFVERVLSPLRDRLQQTRGTKAT